MAEGVIFTGGLAERLVDATDWVERHAGRHGYDPATPPGVEPVFCRVTSGTPTDGLYPGVVTIYSASAGWADFGVVKLKAANGEMLKNNCNYVCRPTGQTVAGDQVYVAATVPLTMHGVLDGDLDVGGSATVSIYDDFGTDTGLNVGARGWHTPHRIHAGMHVHVLMDRDGSYYAIAPATMILRGTLNNDLNGPSGTASATMSHGGTVTVSAWMLGVNSVPAGKQIVAWYDTYNGGWYLLHWEL